jgi:hypothetical protein
MEWNKNNHGKKPRFFLSYDLAPPAPPLQAGIGKPGLQHGEEKGYERGKGRTKFDDRKEAWVSYTTVFPQRVCFLFGNFIQFYSTRWGTPFLSFGLD